MLRNQIFNGQNSGSARAFLNFPVVNPEGEFVGGVLDPPYPTKGFFFLPLVWLQSSYVWIIFLCECHHN